MSTSIKGLLFVMLYCKEKSKNEEYRKKSSRRGARTSPNPVFPSKLPPSKCLQNSLMISSG